MKIKMCEIRGKKLITNWNLSVLNLPFHLDFDGWRLGYRKQFLFVYLFSLQADETFGGNSQQDVGRTHLDVISSWPQCLPASPQVKMLTGRLDSRFPPEMLQSEQNKTMFFCPLLLQSPTSLVVTSRPDLGYRFSVFLKKHALNICSDDICLLAWRICIWGETF